MFSLFFQTDLDSNNCTYAMKVGGIYLDLLQDLFNHSSVQSSIAIISPIFGNAIYC